MIKSEKKLNIMTALFCACLVISNVVACKVIDTGIYLFGSVITIPGAVLCYPLTYLITDIVGEKWGKKSANRIVWTGLAAQLLATFIIMVTQYMPTVSAETQKAYDMLLGQNWIFTLGSLTAYLVSQSLDVSVFHKIRDAYIKKHGSTKGGRWIWNNASTLTSQLVDTTIFCVIAFGVGFGWLWDNPQAVVNMVIGQYLVKACIALLDTPFFYFFTKRRSAEEDCCENTN